MPTRSSITAWTFLWNGHRDAKNGGYFWGVGEDGPSDPQKQAYGHAFVLLAASSAKVVGHPDADRLLADVSEVLRTRFWEKAHGAVAEEFDADWTPISNYRGQNSNMHLTEALMAAFEATGDKTYLEMAESIATLVIAEARRGERLARCRAFQRELGARPRLCQRRRVSPLRHHARSFARMDAAAAAALGARRPPAWLAARCRQGALSTAPSRRAGTPSAAASTTRSTGTASRGSGTACGGRCAEGIGAAAFLNAIDGAREYEDWYRRIWDFAANQLIDREHGGWRTEAVDPSGKPGLFEGKPDLYHALQACLIPLLPTTGSITRGLTTVGLT